MRRRIVWRNGDSPPVFGHIVSAVDPSGDGEIKIVVGFPVSSAMVAFASSANRFLKDYYGTVAEYAYAPSVVVSAIDDDGFSVCYRNIADSLDINYFVT